MTAIYKNQVQGIINLLKNNKKIISLKHVYFPKFEKGQTAIIAMTDAYVLVHIKTNISDPGLSGKVISLEKLIQWKSTAKSTEYLSEEWLLGNCETPEFPFPETFKLLPRSIKPNKDFQGEICIDSIMLSTVQKICGGIPRLLITGEVDPVYFEYGEFNGIVMPIRQSFSWSIPVETE